MGIFGLFKTDLPLHEQSSYFLKDFEGVEIFDGHKQHKQKQKREANLVNHVFYLLIHRTTLDFFYQDKEDSSSV